MSKFFKFVIFALHFVIIATQFAGLKTHVGGFLGLYDVILKPNFRLGIKQPNWTILAGDISPGCKKSIPGQNTGIICDVTRGNEFLLCKNNNYFVMEGAEWTHRQDFVLFCQAEFPLDIEVIFSVPSYLRATLFYGNTVGVIYEETSQNTTVYTLVITYQFNRFFNSFGRSSVLIRLNIYNPLNPTTQQAYINIFKHLRKSNTLLNHRGVQSVCKDIQGKIILPCVSFRPEIPMFLLELNNNQTTEVGSQFSYDPAIGFWNVSYERENFPWNGLLCSTSPRLSNSSEVTLFLGENVAPAQECETNQLPTKKMNDADGNFLRCRILRTFQDHELFRTDKPHHIECWDLYANYNDSFDRQKLTFRMAAVTIENPTAARHQAIQFFMDIRGFVDEIVSDAADTYVMPAPLTSTIILFESDYHFLIFQDFYTLDGELRILPVNYQDLNKQWLMEINHVGCSTNDSSDSVSEFYTEFAYCFTCKIVTSLIHQGVAWHVLVGKEKSTVLLGNGVFENVDKRGTTYSLKTKLNSTFESVICRSTVYNGQPINISFSLNVTESEIPKVLNHSDSAKFKEDTSLVEISCIGKGIPIPGIIWLQNGTELSRPTSETILDSTTIKSTIEFDLVQKNDAGLYECIFTNFRGYSNASINVTVLPRPDYTLAIVISVSAVFLLTLLCVGILVRKYRQNKDNLSTAEINQFRHGKTKKGKLRNNEREPHEIINSISYDERSYEIPSCDFVIHQDQILGVGAYGIVYAASVRKSKAAAKAIRETAGKIHLLALLKELKIMGYIGNHENILSLIGAHTSKLHKGQVFIFVEFCEHGSLHDYLRKYDPYSKVELEDNGAKELTTQLLVSWCYQIASGMEHLASKKVVHGDLATRNVLLTFDFTAKISDFGLSHKLYNYIEYHKANEEPLPWRWMAIETLQSLTFSEKSDVWSYGVTLWEIFSYANIPYPGLNWSTNFVSQLKENLRLEKPEDVDQDIFEIMLECWRTNPIERPSFVSLTRDFITITADPSNRPNRVGVIQKSNEADYTYIK